MNSKNSNEEKIKRKSQSLFYRSLSKKETKLITKISNTEICNTNDLKIKKLNKKEYHSIAKLPSLTTEISIEDQNITEDVNQNKTIFLKITNTAISCNLKFSPQYLFTNFSSSKLKLAEEKSLPITFSEIDTSKPKNKKFRCYHKTYKDAPTCITSTFLNSSCKKVKSPRLANITWKLYKEKKMRLFISCLAGHQKYNHFPKTFQLGRKDNLWKNFCRMKNKFPDDYNYMPKTFILPGDSKKFRSNKTNYKTTWIFKPVASSRGRGIRVLEKDEIKLIIEQSEMKTSSDYLISRYIGKPHLINGKKYDLRIYVLITSFSPLKVYLFRQGIVRFASEEYTRSNKENIFIHLTNYSVNKSNIEKSKIEDGDEDKNALKWNLSMYENYFIENNIHNEYKNIFEKIKDIIIKSILSVTEDSYQHAKLSTKHRNSLFELYGYDILIDEAYDPWLLEVNVSPSLNCDSELDLKLKSELIGDIVNIIGIIPAGILNEKEMNKSRNYNTPNNSDKKNNPSKYNDNFKKHIILKCKIKLCKDYDYSDFNKNELKLENEEILIWNEYYNEIIAEFQSEFIRSQLTVFEQIFPKDQVTILNYLKYLKHPGDENILLWHWFLKFK